MAFARIWLSNFHHHHRRHKRCSCLKISRTHRKLRAGISPHGHQYHGDGPCRCSRHGKLSLPRLLLPYRERGDIVETIIFLLLRVGPARKFDAWKSRRALVSSAADLGHLPSFRAGGDDPLRAGNNHRHQKRYELIRGGARHRSRRRHICMAKVVNDRLQRSIVSNYHHQRRWWEIRIFHHLARAYTSAII